jgi:hypothetical protein
MDNNEKTLENTIKSYLQKKKKAGDTLRGITEWWLESERIDKSVDCVTRALENLAQQGIIERLGLDKQENNDKGEYFFYRLRDPDSPDPNSSNQDSQK